MRRVRFQLSAWKSHRPLPIPTKCPVAGCKPPRRDTPRYNLGRARQMRRGRCRGRITRVRTKGAAAPSAEVGRVRWVEWRESVPTVWRDVSPDQRRGLFSDWKDGSFGQDCRGCAARARQAMSRAVMACPRVTVSLHVGPERRQDERLCEPRWIPARACLNAWRKPDENETGRRYREQPAERICLALASDHPWGEAGGEFSYSTLSGLSSLDRDQMRHTVRDGGRAPRIPGSSGHDQ